MSEAKVFKLSRLLQSVRKAVESATAGRAFWVRAEVASLRFHNQGHAYLDLVEEQSGKALARVRAMIWKEQLEELREELGPDFNQVLKVGSQVQVEVLVRFHELYGLSLEILALDLNFNLGNWELRKRQTLQALKKAGLLERNAQLPFPIVAQKIALIGAPDSEGWNDFLHQLQNHEAEYAFYIQYFPARVQGPEAAPEIRSRLRQIDERFDVVVLLRGGGAKLDLDVFNDLKLCEAVANLPIPLIAAIGHHRDRTVVDEIAHQSLKTPTAAAVYLIENLLQFENALWDDWDSILQLSKQILQSENNKLQSQRSIWELRAVHFVQNLSAQLNRQKDQINFLSGRLLESQKQKLIQHSMQLRSGLALRQERLLGKLQQSFTLLQQVSRNQLNNSRERLGKFQADIELGANSELKNASRDLSQTEKIIHGYHPDRILARGFAYLKQHGKTLSAEDSVSRDAKIEIVRKEDTLEVELLEQHERR